MDRRQFIIKSSFLFGGLSIPSFLRASNNNTDVIIYKEEIWPILGKLARDVGVGIISSLVTDYLKGWLWPEKDKSLIANINNTNSLLNQRGYTNTSQSSVYSSSKVYKNEPQLYKEKAVNDTILYALSNERTGETVIPVFNRKSQRKSGILHEPDILGLGRFADMLLSRGYSQNYISNTLLPTSFLQEAIGSVKEGYRQSTEFKTKNGSLSIMYKVFSLDRVGKGEIRIDAVIKEKSEYFKFPVEFDL